MRRRALIQDFMVVALAIACTASGYYWGKHAADRWYARNIPCSTHCLTYPVQNEGVTLIQPIRVRTAAPVANLQEPR